MNRAPTPSPRSPFSFSALFPPSATHKPGEGTATDVQAEGGDEFDALMYEDELAPLAAERETALPRVEQSLPPV